MLAVSVNALSNTGGEHAEGIPTVVYWQLLNIGMVIAGLIYYTKNQIKAHFIDRRKTFLALAEKSKAAKLAAEKQYLEIKHKIDLLDSTTDESIARARSEAADVKKNLIQEAQATAAKIKIETKEAAEIESQKAYRNLKQQTIRDSLELARQVLTKDIGNQDHQKLQNDFAKNLSGASL